ncbi:helix-turn-helix transcriptional regulator [Kitasatospora sp. NPDC088391]|uniref:helix-turn-helix transcriptional regulator n=1 Tax=Kitasatospora sp. NPDC088391 TaxID=3364074 RepID=UPI0038135DD0
MEYEFTFVVSGVNVDDESSVESLRESLDAMLSRAGGLDLLTIACEGENAVQAALECAAQAKAAVPTMRVLRLDRDLVGVHEIADRTDRSRQNVAQWVRGERKAKGLPFPGSEGTAGRSQVWLWSEVNTWLEQHGLSDGANYPSRAEMTEIDFALANMFSLSLRVASTDEAHAAARKAVVEELHTRHIPGFLNYLSSLDGTTDATGSHVLIVAAAQEPAVEVMRMISGFEHQVVLITKVGDDFIGSVMSSRVPARPTRIVEVPLDATVRDWIQLIKDHPRVAFTPSVDRSIGRAGAERGIQQVLGIAA